MKRFSSRSRAGRAVAAGAVLAAAQLGGVSAASALPEAPAAEGTCPYPAPVVTETDVSLDLAVMKAGSSNTARVTVSSDKGPAEGSVTFTVEGYAPATVALVGGTASYTLPTDLAAGDTYEVTAVANVTGCLQPSSATAYVTVTGDDDAVGGTSTVNRAAPTVSAPGSAAPSSGLLPSVGAAPGTAILAAGGAALLAAGLLSLVRARRRAGG